MSAARPEVFPERIENGLDQARPRGVEIPRRRRRWLAADHEGVHPPGCGTGIRAQHPRRILEPMERWRSQGIGRLRQTASRRHLGMETLEELARFPGPPRFLPALPRSRFYRSNI